MVKFFTACLVLLTFTAMAKAEYYFLLFSHDYQKKPHYSHIWATFVKTNQNTIEKEFTISWHPITDWKPGKGRMSGYNKTLQASMEDAFRYRRRVCLWGPYAIHPIAFDQAYNRYVNLNQNYMYQAIDSPKSRNNGSTNCIHAVSDIIPGLRTNIMYGEGAGQAIIAHFFRHGYMRRANDENLIRVLGLDRYNLVRK